MYVYVMCSCVQPFMLVIASVSWSMVLLISKSQVDNNLMPAATNERTNTVNLPLNRLLHLPPPPTVMLLLTLNAPDPR